MLSLGVVPYCSLDVDPWCCPWQCTLLKVEYERKSRHPRIKSKVITNVWIHKPVCLQTFFSRRVIDISYLCGPSFSSLPLCCFLAPRPRSLFPIRPLLSFFVVPTLLFSTCFILCLFFLATIWTLFKRTKWIIYPFLFLFFDFSIPCFFPYLTFLIYCFSPYLSIHLCLFANPFFLLSLSFPFPLLFPTFSYCNARAYWTFTIILSQRGRGVAIMAPTGKDSAVSWSHVSLGILPNAWTRPLRIECGRKTSPWDKKNISRGERGQRELGPNRQTQVVPEERNHERVAIGAKYGTVKSWKTVLWEPMSTRPRPPWDRRRLRWWGNRKERCCKLADRPLDLLNPLSWWRLDCDKVP